MPRFRILRYFSLTSFAFVIAAALALSLIYRYVAIANLIHLGERANITLAQMALNPLRPQLMNYLATGDSDPNRLAHNKTLEQAVLQAMHDTAVQRIKIYNHEGIVVFSTKSEQIGGEQENNGGFRAAIEGHIASKLIYRDTFNVFDQTTEDDNLIQTYLPVRTAPDKPVVGVFEVYTGVTEMVVEVERAEITIILGAVTVLLLLYGTMLVIVRRAEGIIERQEAIIRERTHTLEMLAAKLLTVQESEKKRIAGGLHEGIAQTLAAVKIHLEAATARSRQDTNGTPDSLALVGVVQKAIQEVRALATELRPSSLDDLGLTATMDWYCRQFRTAHPDLRLDLRTDVDSANISASLATIIYRIFQDTVEAIARSGRTSSIDVALEQSPGAIVLTVDDDSLPAAVGEADNEQRIMLAALRERATLSGGTVKVEEHRQGGQAIHVSWPA
jgi:signal transduction histidine kinase